MRHVTNGLTGTSRSMSSAATHGRFWMTALIAWLALGMGTEVVRGYDVPFFGVVTGDDTAINSGAGRIYYKTGILDKGTLVRVDQVIHGWYKITPPAGHFSYVSKAFVDAHGDGKAGTTNRNRVAVKAVNINDPANSYRTQMSLSRGTEVRIVGDHHGYYRIEPPAGVYVYVSQSTIRRATRTEIADARHSSDELKSKDPAKALPAKSPPKIPALNVKTTRTREQPEPAEAATTKGSPGATAHAPLEVKQVHLSAKQVVAPPQLKSESVATDKGDIAKPTTADAKPRDPVVPPGSAAHDTQRGSKPTEAGAQVQPNPSEKIVEQLLEVDSPETADAAPPTPTVNKSSSSAPVAMVKQSSATQKSQPPARGGPSVAPDQPENPELAELERRFPQVKRITKNRQPIEQLLAQYQSLAAQKTGAINKKQGGLIERRITALRRRLMVVDAMAKVAIARNDNANRTAIRLQPVSEEAGSSTLGWLRASTIYNGKRLPRLYKLVDPATNRTIAYIRPGPAINAPLQLGRLVTVEGQAGFDVDLKIRLIDATEARLVRTASP